MRPRAGFSGPAWGREGQLLDQLFCAATTLTLGRELQFLNAINPVGCKDCSRHDSWLEYGLWIKWSTAGSGETTGLEAGGLRTAYKWWDGFASVAVLPPPGLAQGQAILRRVSRTMLTIFSQ